MAAALQHSTLELVRENTEAFWEECDARRTTALARFGRFDIREAGISNSYVIHFIQAR
jgi:hypothetical protein